MSDTLIVNLGERSYPIHFGADLSTTVRAEVRRLQAENRKPVVVTDTTVQRAQAAALSAMFGDAPVVAVAPGESAKSLSGLGAVLDFLGAQKVDRRGVVFAVGGGVVGDLAGFAAASWLRGVEFQQLPTTLLAMVDSSVGGKTGINIAAGKNLVGAFHQPRAVYVSTDVLRTLPPREFAAGMAEVVKYGLLGDAALFDQLAMKTLTVESPELADVIRRCCAAKARVVELDERETAATDGRALLNLGHTFGHAIENVAGYGSYLHGEAVAIGLHAAALLSQRLGHIDAAVVSRVVSTLEAHRLPTRLHAPLPLAALKEAMQRDKKVRAGGVRFVVLKAVGRAATQAEVPANLVDEVFRHVGAA